MKCCYIKSVNGKTVFESRQAPMPQPKRGEILVRVRAASLNRGEILASISLHSADVPHPAGADCAGEVHAIGEGVTAFRPGERVLGRARGSFAEFVAMSADQAALVPERLTWEQAAAVPIVSVTAYEILCSYGRLKAGETLLVAGAASGVGVMCVQAGKYIGVRVIGTSRSAEKLQKLKSVGLDVGIETNGGGFADKVLEATGGKGVNLAANLIGASVFPDCLRSLANQGRLAICGYVDDKFTAEVDLQAVHTKRLQIYGVSNAMFSAAGRAEAMRNFVRDLLPGFAEGRITPLVDRVFPFDELPAAKTYVETNAQLGKVVVRMPS
ncbi:MAG TPA: zinc-binding dehydrogenase [Burkholderiales bacterium]|nr:zinc-binding dehydrogenase [Burkholderiales bacterium]